MLQQYHAFLARIQPALLKHFNDERLTGTDFAQWIIDSDPQGRTSYEALKQAGKEQVLFVMRTYPPLWSQIGMAQQKLNQFLDEFMRYDDVMSEPEEETGEAPDVTDDEEELTTG